MEMELRRLNLHYSHIKEAVDNFTFTSLPEKSLCEWGEENMEKVQGLAAFDRICCQMTRYHNDESGRLMNEPSMKELKNILQLIKRFIDQLNGSLSDGENGEAQKNIIHYYELVNYLFKSKISVAQCFQAIIAEGPKQEKNKSEKTEKHSIYCTVCGYKHGIPDEIKEDVKWIKTKLQEFEAALVITTQTKDIEKND